MFSKVLIANRGEIALRIAKTLRRMGIASVAVYSDADRNSPHVTFADEAFYIGESPPVKSYLRADIIIDTALRAGAQAVIPGYGFLSENPEFAEACEAAGVVFVGPSPDQIREFGLKHRSRERAREAGVPLVPGTGLIATLEEALAAADVLGFPLMVKSTAGGGGIGLMRCGSEHELEQAFGSVKRLGENFFKNDGLFLERCIDHARHIEVQIFGDGKGRVIALGERDCSTQRRNQKVIEETPAPGISEATRASILDAAVRLGATVSYRSAGTVEFIYDVSDEAFYFLEVNTRLQVEHPVTEAVSGLDLVEWMIRIAAGESPDFTTPVPRSGAAIEVRLYAEDPFKQFQPSPGVLTEVFFPDGVRVDGWVSNGSEVSPYYDPMIAKLIVKGKDRSEALDKLNIALSNTRLYGIATNLEYLRTVVATPQFREGTVTTRFLDSLSYAPRTVEVTEPGTYSTVQDYPGRVGYWAVGVPPSGPMDDYAFRMANRIVGNPPEAAGIEATIIGPSLRFHTDCLVSLTGAPADAVLDGLPVEFWHPLQVKAGQELRMGKVRSGCRTYLAIKGGFDVPEYLGSRSTFVLGQFGGHIGRPLKAGDMLSIAFSPEPVPTAVTPSGPRRTASGASFSIPSAAPPALIPRYTKDWEIGVLYGPHGAPDFFLSESIETFFETAWEVHYNSNRLGIRLIGPKPAWTRSDGGEAGLHPSNIHDCEYAVGSINFTGDMPVILTRDGPSLGGFVCPVTIAKAELWKVGQVKPGDLIRFRKMDFQEALDLEKAQDKAIAGLSPVEPEALSTEPVPVGNRTGRSSAVMSGNGAFAGSGIRMSETVLAYLPEQGDRPEVAYRQAGDKYILLEYGPNILDLRLRFRVHGLMESLAEKPIPGILELSPGVRSLQINYDSRIIHQAELLDALIAAEDRIPSAESMKIATRIVHLPLAFEDSATLDAVAKYRQSVRDTAPWLPNNVDFITRINGLGNRDQVKDIVYSARYLVLGLGDVYLGAPCAVPVDPRHRLLTSKYNPARTFTAEGTVGIGGVYMCIYGMDSPGGYQLVGRTLPIWNKFLKNESFAEGKPWLLRFFDQVSFFPVTEKELASMRDDFREGRLNIDIEEEVFDLGAHDRFLEEHAADIAAFKARQKTAFEAEVSRWQADQGQAIIEATDVSAASTTEDIIGHIVSAEIHGNIWKLLVEIGHNVAKDDPILILEAMKMEITVRAPVAGTIGGIHCSPGKQVATGDTLVVITPH